jgi:4-alpha-glucanotransferase
MSIGLISDIAVGSDSGGSQAWAHRPEMLDGLSIGSPPDDFNARGQNWGVTSFSPHGLHQSAYRPFIDLLRSSLQYAGGIRLDHILGLARLWVVPNGNEATNGVYLRYPLADLLRLTALESHRAQAFILGEDLGTVPPGFREKLRDAGIAGMQVLWFERTSDGFARPEDWSPQAVGMTTTHDLPTVAGWWRGSDIGWREKTAMMADDMDVKRLRRERHHERQQLWQSFQQAGDKKTSQPTTASTSEVVDSAIGFLGKTACDLVLLPLEDVIGLVDQPNLPGTIDEHPNWRRRLPLTTLDIFQDRAVKQRLRTLKRRRAKS